MASQGLLFGTVQKCSSRRQPGKATATALNDNVSRAAAPDEASDVDDLDDENMYLSVCLAGEAVHEGGGGVMESDVVGVALNRSCSFGKS